MVPAAGRAPGAVLYVSCMVDAGRAWRPRVPGVREVLHATFRDHAYPAHTHDAWTLLLIDTGAVRYGLDRDVHVAPPASLSILPPGIPHDGRSAVPGREFHRSEEHTSELQSLMRLSFAVFCLKKTIIIYQPR